MDIIYCRAWLDSSHYHLLYYVLQDKEWRRSWSELLVVLDGMTGVMFSFLTNGCNKTDFHSVRIKHW